MIYQRLMLIVIVAVCMINQLYAQSGDITIQFKLENDQPAENATVLIQSLSPGSSKNALLTDRDGIIRLKKDSSRYSLSVEFTGMEPINDTLLTDGKTDTIRYTFKQSFTELEAVQIVNRKKIIEVNNDRFIYNVSADSSARSKSLSQVLNHLPFVAVDGTGNVTVAGQTSYKVLLNGKETALFANSIAQALRSYPAEIVSRIELITSPGARYDAEGVTAIINIITKKFTGYKGFGIAYASNRTHFSDGLTVTGSAGKFGIVVNAAADGTWNPLKEYKTTVTTPLQSSVYQHRTVKGEGTDQQTSVNGTIELSYEVDSLHTLIGYVTADKTHVRNHLSQEVSTALATGESEMGQIEMNSEDQSPGLVAGLDYTQKGRKNPAKELSFRFNWSGADNIIDNTTVQEYDSFSKWMINHSVAENDEYTFQLDAKPIAAEKITLETGAKTIFRKAATDYSSLFTFDESDAYIQDANNSNSFNYRQQVYAAYGALSARLEKNNIRAGLRLEQTNINGVFGNLSNPVKSAYFSVIPNLFWSLKTGTATTASLSYNVNLQRPNMTSLNPYVNNTDSFNVSYGNPGLGPQKIHNLVAQLRYNNEKLFVAATLTGSWSNNKILSYRLFDAATGISATTFGNAGREQLIAIGLNSRYAFSGTFVAGLGGELRYVDIRNRLQKSQYNFGYSGIVTAFFTWDVSKHFNLSGSGGMDVRNVTLLGSRSPFYFYQINSGYHIIKDKLYVTVNWNNLHGNYYTQRIHFKDDMVRNETTFKGLYRVIFVGFQYTFGKLRQEVARKKGVTNDDILK